MQKTPTERRGSHGRRVGDVLKDGCRVRRRWRGVGGSRRSRRSVPGALWAEQVLQGALLLPHVAGDDAGTPGGGRRRLWGRGAGRRLLHLSLEWWWRRHPLFLQAGSSGKCEDVACNIFPTEILKMRQNNKLTIALFLSREISIHFLSICHCR